MTTYSPVGAPGSEVVKTALRTRRETILPKGRRAELAAAAHCSAVTADLNSGAAALQLFAYWSESRSCNHVVAALVACCSGLAVSETDGGVTSVVEAHETLNSRTTNKVIVLIGILVRLAPNFDLTNFPSLPNSAGSCVTS